MTSTTEHVLQPDMADPLAALLTGTLPAHVFDHRNHVYTAWRAMRRYGIAEGADRFRRALRAYVSHLNAADKYHVTITEAYLRLIAQQVERGFNEPNWQCAWAEFECNAAHLLESSRVVLAAYYSEALLGNEAAKRHFVPADRCALPHTVLDLPMDSHSGVMHA